MITSFFFCLSYFHTLVQSDEEASSCTLIRKTTYDGINTIDNR